ncbi:hypothetical protein LINGRAHAP2_LOCUS22063 [Linum grandiflorum]
MVALTLTMEIITQAASSPIWVFLFCNVIIVTILVSSKPPPSHPHPTCSEIRHVSISGAFARHALFSGDENRVVSNSKPECSKIEFERREEDDDVEEEEVIEKGDCDELEEDELRKRIEEFIEKTNKEWRAELIRGSKLVR